MINIYDIVNDPMPTLHVVDRINKGPHCLEPSYPIELLIKKYNIDKLIYERCYCVAFDENENIIGITMISSGSNDECQVYNRIIATFLLLVDATQFIMIHNHPNGITEASDEDISSMHTVDMLGKMIGVEMVEDYVVTKNGWYATRERRRKSK